MTKPALSKYICSEQDSEISLAVIFSKFNYAAQQSAISLAHTAT